MCVGCAIFKIKRFLQLIERHGWIFREMEMVDRERQLPWWDEVLKAESVIPFRSQLYPQCGKAYGRSLCIVRYVAIEGGEAWTVPFGASLMRPPEKRSPVGLNEDSS